MCDFLSLNYLHESYLFPFTDSHNNNTNLEFTLKTSSPLSLYFPILLHFWNKKRVEK